MNFTATGVGGVALVNGNKVMDGFVVEHNFRPCRPIFSPLLFGAFRLILPLLPLGTSPVLLRVRAGPTLKMKKHSWWLEF